MTLLITDVTYNSKKYMYSMLDLINVISKVIINKVFISIDIVSTFLGDNICVDEVSLASKILSLYL